MDGLATSAANLLSLFYHLVQISTRSSLTTNSHLYRILTLPQFTSEELSSVKETDVTPQLRDGSHDDDVMLAGDDGEGLLN